MIAWAGSFWILWTLDWGHTYFSVTLFYEHSSSHSHHVQSILLAFFHLSILLGRPNCVVSYSSPRSASGLLKMAHWWPTELEITMISLSTLVLCPVLLRGSQHVRPFAWTACKGSAKGCLLPNTSSIHRWWWWTRLCPLGHRCGRLWQRKPSTPCLGEVLSIQML